MSRQVALSSRLGGTSCWRVAPGLCWSRAGSRGLHGPSFRRGPPGRVGSGRGDGTTLRGDAGLPLPGSRDGSGPGPPFGPVPSGWRPDGGAVVYCRGIFLEVEVVVCCVDEEGSGIDAVVAVVVGVAGYVEEVVVYVMV